MKPPYSERGSRKPDRDAAVIALWETGLSGTQVAQQFGPTIRLCTDCGHHEAMRDSAQCHDCLNRYLERTRPPGLRVSPWVERAQEHRLPARVTGGSAA